MYFGYCQESRRYRMMDLPDYVSNVQEGLSQLMNEGASAYQGMLRDYAGMAGGAGTMREPAFGTWSRGRRRGCGCDDSHDGHECHCECCVSDADVLVHARCGEVRRIPLTFENETRRDRPVTLQLEKFVTSGGRDLGWNAQLSETQFTLRPCDEHTVTLLVQIRCDDTTKPTQPAPGREPANRPEATPAGTAAAARSERSERTEASAAATMAAAVAERFGSVDRCEVGYATIRAEGCLTRPVVVAIAVLPDDCDAYRTPCGCDCCG
jgi:hypothetical protein